MSRPARASRPPRSRWVVLWTLLAGQFAVNVLFTVFAISLPRVAKDLHTSTNTATWVITAPLLLLGLAAPALGKGGDLWGHRRLYLWSMAAGAVFAACSAVAWNAGSLIVARSLAGMAGAGSAAASMALIFTVFVPAERVNAMGFWTLVSAGAPAMGVVVGGPLVQALGWRVIFWGQVPMVLLTALVAVAVLPETDARGRQRLDWAGALTLGVGVGGFLFGLNRGPEWGWGSAGVMVAFAASPLALVTFVAVERRAAHPLLPLHYLRRRNFTFPILVSMCANFPYMGGFILAPILLHRVFGLDEGRISLLVLARPTVFAVMSPIAGYLTVRVGERSAAVAGCLAVGGSMLVFAGLGPSSPEVMIVGALALSGVGLGVCSPAIAASVANAVDEASFGVSSAALALLTEVGVVAGIQVLQTVQASTEASRRLMGSFAAAYGVGAAVALVGAVAGLFMATMRRPSRLAEEAAAITSDSGPAAAMELAAELGG